MAFQRIERDPKTGDYDGYVPKAGDVWSFHDGQRWPVTWTDACGLSVGPNAATVTLSPFFLPVRSLTSHIERPVRTVTVPKEGYVPRVGDRLCGPEGVAFRLTLHDVRNDTYHAEHVSGRYALYLLPGSVTFEAVIDLCHHIERDEA